MLQRVLPLTFDDKLRLEKKESFDTDTHTQTSEAGATKIEKF